MSVLAESTLPGPISGTVSGDLTVTGDLLIGGQIDCTTNSDLNLVDPIVIINDGETGAGITNGSAGIWLDRGTEDNYEFTYYESDGKLKAGLTGEQRVVARGDVGTKGYIPFGLAEGVTMQDDAASDILDDAGDGITDNTSADLFLTESSKFSWDNNSYKLDIDGDLNVTGTGYVQLPTGTTAQRPSTAVAGMMRYNSTTSVAEVYYGAEWGSVGVDDHSELTSIGTNTHAQIDTAVTASTNHIADATLHFTEASIVHQNISGAGTNTHAQIDTAVTNSTNHIADATLHFTEASIDHGSIAGLSDDDHTQYSLADGSRAFSGGVTVSAGGVSVTGNSGFGVAGASAFGNLHVKSGASGVGAAVAGADELVLEGSGDTGLSVLSGANSNGSIAFGDTADADVGLIDYDHNDNSMAFSTAGAVAMTIDSAGEVGIGTAAPDEALHVVGTAKITADINAAGLPTGATAVAAGAAAGDLWVTASHATLPDGVVMRG